MPTLRQKAIALLRIARSIQNENFWDEVTGEEQRRLEEIVRAVDMAAHLLLLHVDAVERGTPYVPTKRKLRVVK